MSKTTKSLLVIGAIIFIVLISCLLLLLNSNKSPTWQEQYDLGIRYLFDGNYQEAIIAFTAAIEIDAMRPEAYLKAAEAYEAVGDSEAARAILEKGYAATGDESLKPKEETLNMWILDDFISPQELTVGNVPFYLTDIYTAYELYRDRYSQPPVTYDGVVEEIRLSAEDGAAPSFVQSPDADVLWRAIYYGSNQPEFRGIVIGMSATEALKRLSFTDYAIQEILDFAESGIEYDENDMESKIQIEIGKTQISVYNGMETLYVVARLFRNDNEVDYGFDNGVYLYLHFRNNVLESVLLDNLNMYNLH